MKKRIHIVAGATASGKSARALALAKERDGVVINADATQLYLDLKILSARPDPQEMENVPHKLYGVLEGQKVASAASWLEMARREITHVWHEGKLPIICGGTGFYIKTLLEGLSPIPDVPEEIKQETSALLASEGNAAFHARLHEVDSLLAEKFDSGNSQRLMRAYNVWKATGKPLSHWQKIPPQKPFSDAEFKVEVIEIEREVLYARCNDRFDAMMRQGAVDEVEALLKNNYPATLPIMKAVGVPELTAYLQGEKSREEAVALAKQNTRRYAKRQLTWLRHQL